MFNPTEKLELLAASASEIHAAGERGKIRVEFKSDEDRTRKRQTRLLKNRQSAALSRQRKKEYINDLEERTNGLITENHNLAQKVTKLSSMNLEFKMHIDTLEKCLSETKNENMELRARLAAMSGTNHNTHNNNNNNQSPSPTLIPCSSPPSTSTTTTTTTSTSSPSNESQNTSNSPTPVQNPSVSP